MAKLLLWATMALLAISSCQTSKYETTRPVFVKIPEIRLEDNPQVEEGSLHNSISMVWIRLNGEVVGAFELPATVPLLLDDGNNDLEFFSGIKLNGVSSQRVIYDYYEAINKTISFNSAIERPVDTVVFNDLQTQYSEIATINLLENFDDAGLSLTATAQSDTGIYKVSDSSLVFRDPEHPGQNNGKAGVIYTDEKNDRARIVSAQSLELPTNGSDVYVELTYRCNQPFYVGLMADLPGQTTERPVVRVNTKNEWNKIYINLVTELSALSGADNFKLLLSVNDDKDGEPAAIYVDNIKIVY